jgi:hypothetical protein
MGVGDVGDLTKEIDLTLNFPLLHRSGLDTGDRALGGIQMNDSLLGLFGSLRDYVPRWLYRY